MHHLAEVLLDGGEGVGNAVEVPVAVGERALVEQADARVAPGGSAHAGGRSVNTATRSASGFSAGAAIVKTLRLSMARVMAT